MALAVSQDELREQKEERREDVSLGVNTTLLRKSMKTKIFVAIQLHASICLMKN